MASFFCFVLLLLFLVWREGVARPEDRKSCSVFVHINKSGGQSLKYILASHLRGRRVALCSETQFVRNGCRPPARFPRVGASVACWLFVGDSAAALETWIPRTTCAYFTVFRRPEARLVSAYRYCRAARRDHLCGTARLDSRNATLAQWADHQRGFVFLRLSLGRLATVATAPAVGTTKGDHDDDDPADDETFFRSRAAPSWLRFQRASLRPNASEDGALAAMARGIERGTLFDAVGILENIPDTARVFDRVVPLTPPLTWRRAFDESPRLNAAAARKGPGVEEEEEEDLAEAALLLAAAATDPAIRRALDYDYPLYRAAEVALEQAVAALPTTTTPRYRDDQCQKSLPPGRRRPNGYR